MNRTLGRSQSWKQAGLLLCSCGMDRRVEHASQKEAVALTQPEDVAAAGVLLLPLAFFTLTELLKSHSNSIM